MANLPIQDLPDGGVILPTDLLVIARPTDGNLNFKVSANNSDANPFSIYFQQELPNADSSAMAPGGLFMNRTAIGAINPTYDLPTGNSTVIKTGSIIQYMNLGNNLPTIRVTGSDVLRIDGGIYSQVRPQLQPAGGQNYNITFTRTGSSAWALTLNGPFTGALNAS